MRPCPPLTLLPQYPLPTLGWGGGYSKRTYIDISRSPEWMWDSRRKLLTLALDSVLCS